MIKKKIYIFIITLIILISFVNIGYANSGPTYWKGYPTFEILSIKENSPIVVENEDLVFDFSKKEYLERDDHSISGFITATYTMSNQSNDDETVQMAFPFVSSLRYFNPEDVAIKVDDQDIPFDIYMGEKLDDDNLNFNSIVRSIRREVYVPQNYDLNEVGTLYKYDVSADGEENVNFVISFTYDNEKTKIITKEFNSYGWENNEASISSWIRDKETVEVYTIGENVDLNISVYKDGERTQKTDNYSSEMKKEKLTIEDYLKRSIENYEYSAVYNDYLFENQLFNLFSKELDEIFGHNVNFLTLEDLFSSDYEERVFVFIYDTHFPKQSNKNISISYLSKGTMDRTSTIDPLYTFEYLLNPAENWADFRNLNIEIKPPNEHPYIVDSSIDLIKNDEGNYVGYFESLPDKDLFFTLYSKEKVTFIDKIKKKVSNLTYAIPLINIIGIPILIGIFIIKKLKKVGEP